MTKADRKRHSLQMALSSIRINTEQELERQLADDPSMADHDLAIATIFRRYFEMVIAAEMASTLDAELKGLLG